MTEVANELKPDDAPVDTPPEPTPAPADDLDQLLQEFQDKTAPPEPEPELSPDGGKTGGETLDQQIEQLLGPDPRISELQGQIDAFKASEFQAQERQAAEAWASELQDVCSRSNPNVEDDFVIREIKVLSADNPGLLEQAWAYRNLSDADLAIAKRDFAAAEQLYQRVLAQPDTEPQKQNALRYLEQRGAQLQAMLSARNVIRNARNEIRKRADAVKAGYDEDVSAWRTEIAASMRGASMPVNFRDPPPDLGKMDDQTFRKWKLENLGWE
jgi:hypothetical protein